MLMGHDVLMSLSFLSLLLHQYGGSMAWNSNNNNNNNNNNIIIIPMTMDMIDRREAWMAIVGTAISTPTATATTTGGWMASSLASTTPSSRIIPPTLDDPPPLLTVFSSTNDNNKNSQRPREILIRIPRVGYSLFKTPPEQAERCTLLALLAGVTHFDLATQYSNNTTAAVGCAIQRYLKEGRAGIRKYLAATEKEVLLELMDRTHQQQQTMMMKERGIGGNSRYEINSSSLSSQQQQQRRRRQGLFLHYKLANQEQSTDFQSVRQAVERALQLLQVDYLDMVSIHSPLTDTSRRIATYRSLLELQHPSSQQSSTQQLSSSSLSQKPPMVKSIGVCNYGLGPLQELLQAGLPPPIMNQLELSPFHRHDKVVDYCHDHGIVVGCAAWSRLSSADGPTEAWDVLAKLAESKGMTKAQVLVRWALQKGYVCVPRSASASKLERIAIAENSYGGVMNLPHQNNNNNKNNNRGDNNKNNNKKTTTVRRLSDSEMTILDGLNVNYPAGKLGRKDGWDDSDVTGPEWDPTDILV
jgi:diketogulonate reductase-like aldo/keto reductase